MGEFVLSTVNGEVRVGVATGKGEFITWPGSQALPSGGSVSSAARNTRAEHPGRYGLHDGGEDCGGRISRPLL